MSGAVRRCQALSGDVRRCQALSGDVRRCQALSGAVRRCQARYALSGALHAVRRCQTLSGAVRRVTRCQTLSDAVRRCQARYTMSGDVRRVTQCQTLSGALHNVRRCQARYTMSDAVRRCQAMSDAVRHKKTAHDSAARIGNKKAALSGLIGFHKVKCNVTKMASPASLIMRSISSAFMRLHFASTAKARFPRNQAQRYHCPRRGLLLPFQLRP